MMTMHKPKIAEKGTHQRAFWRGVGRAFDLGWNLKPQVHVYVITNPATDSIAISGDFQSVGKDMKSAISRFERASKKVAPSLVSFTND